MQQPRWQLRRSAIRRLSAAPSRNKDLPVNHRNVTREFKIPRQRRWRKWRLKVNLCPYDQVVIISTRLLFQIAGELFWSRIPTNHIQVQKEMKKKISSSLVYVLHKTWNEAFSRRSCAVMAVVVCPSSLLPFWRSRCCRRRRILNSLLYLYFGAFIRRQTIKNHRVTAYTW